MVKALQKYWKLQPERINQYSWALIMIVIVIGAWLIYHTEINSRLSAIELDEQHVIQLASEAIHLEVSSLKSDAMYLAEHATLQRWLRSGKESDRKQMAENLMGFVMHRELYSHIRYLDETGQERLRVNYNKGHPSVVPPSGLQDKSGRYYVRDTLVLPKGSLYISHFDLNMENGRIEKPIKPVLRIGTPVFDRQGRKRGLIILNYLGNRLLSKLKDIRSQHAGELWMLNNRGDWLLGPRKEDEWGFMYPGKKITRFVDEYKDVWQRMVNEKEISQLMYKNELFTFNRVVPGKRYLRPHMEEWVLVAHVPEKILKKSISGRGMFVSMEFIALTLVLALLAAGMTYYVFRKKTDPIIKESEARFSNLFESAPDAIVIVDTKGVIKLVNSMAEKIFGYSRKEIVGEQVEKLIPENIHEKHKMYRRTYAADKPRSMTMAAGKELYAMNKEGGVFPAEINLSPLQTNQGLLITSIIRDISARKQAELEKKHVEARFHSLVNNLPVGVFRYAKHDGGRFLEVNPEMVDIFEAEDSSELMGCSIRELYCKTDAYRLFNKKLEEQGSVYNEEVQMKTLRGREFVASATAVMKKDMKGEIYFDGIIEDISERKKNELEIQALNTTLRLQTAELEASNKELEAFSYSVSHDLRAPLRAIDGFSRTLLINYADKLDEVGKDRLNRIRSAAARMADLIDDLLNLSRVTRTQINRQPVDMSQIAREVSNDICQRDSGRTAQIKIQDDILCRADSRLLRVALENLFGNAWKFTKKKSEACIEFGKTNSGTEAIYYVRDNGAGFNMKYADKLFGAFQRLHDNDEFAGSGIGLATVQRVIHKHSGRIWAESEEDKGATFYFTL